MSLMSIIASIEEERQHNRVLADKIAVDLATKASDLEKLRQAIAEEFQIRDIALQALIDARK